MLCPNCQKEIENDAVFCEHCGTRVKKSKEGLWITLYIVFVLVAGVVLFFYARQSPTYNEEHSYYVDTYYEEHSYYVDLGLPSGTLWKNTNEGGEYALYTYDEAVKNFGSKIATKAQWEELKDYCTWSLTGDGYKVTGPNGNSITLPAAGLRDCNGNMYCVGTYGEYWSSTPDNSDYVWALYFYSSEVDMCVSDRCNGVSVRLVQ